MIKILNFELGNVGQMQNTVTLSSLIMDCPILAHDMPAASMAAATTPDFQAGAETGDAHATGNIDPSLYYNSWFLPEPPPESTLETPADTAVSDAIAVNNQTDYTIDTSTMLNEPLSIALSGGNDPVVLIIHTHGSEAYKPDGTDQYAESDPYRTQDKSQSVIRVGDELASQLSKRGIPLIHDRNFYDYPSYNGSYNRSYDAIQSYLKEYPSIKIVIDVHRDHIPGKEGAVYKTNAQIGDVTCSQIKFVMGTDFSGLNHPNWKENFKLALHIQQKMNGRYPSLTRPITLTSARYAQQATLGSMLIEVGSTGNTLQESLAAVRYFADALSDVVLSLYK